MDPLPLSQHDAEIQQNKRAWETKPLLRAVYAGFYRHILAAMDPSVSGAVVELGSGIGNFKSVYPRAIATDLFSNPWIDQVENAYHLSFSDGSISHLVLFDVFHHLEYPGAALKEFQRVLAPGGRIIIFDPYISLFGFLVYELFHHEPVALMKPITWLPPTTSFDERYYAAQGNATRLFGIGSPYQSPIKKDWRVVKKQKFSALSYILSGGFSKPALYPFPLLPLMRSIEKVFDLFPLLFATRTLIVLEKK